MIELFKRISTIAMMAGILALGTARPARANLEIQLSKTGVGAYTTVAPPGTVFSSSNWNGSGIAIANLGVGSNSPGSIGYADISGSATSLTNVSTSTETLYIKLGDTGFTDPTTPPGFIVFESFISATVNTHGAKTANALTFQSYVDPGNRQNYIGAGTITTGAQSLNIATAGGPASDVTDNVSLLNAPYSVTEYLKVTLGAGGSVNFSSITSLTAVPEPSSLAIAGLGAMGLVGYGFRRRRQGD